MWDSQWKVPSERNLEMKFRDVEDDSDVGIYMAELLTYWADGIMAQQINGNYVIYIKV